MVAGEAKGEIRRERPGPERLGEGLLAELCKRGPMLVATVGLPACGKTTWSNRLLNEAPCFVRVNNDDLREANPYRHEAAIRSMRDRQMHEALASGKSVVVDNTNLRGFSDLRRVAREHNVEFAVQDFRDVPWQECVRRDAERAARGERAVGRSVIIKMAMDARLFELDPSINKEAIIVDLDGTLSDISHREHHVRGKGNKNWKAFFEGIAGDKKNEAVVALYDMAVKGGYTVILLTGRPEDYRIPSEEWLREHKLDDYFALFMRPHNVNKPDTEVKGDIYDRFIKPHFKVLFTVEDRDQVVQMWRAKGLTCFQVAEGKY